MKSIGAWRSKTTYENLGEKYVEEVTGQHIVDLWTNRPVHDEIIHYFTTILKVCFILKK